MSQRSKQMIVPRHLDAPTRWVVFTLDEWVALLVPVFGVSGAFDQLMLGAALGVGLSLGVKSLKARVGVAHVWARLAWHVPGLMPFQRLPRRRLRFFVG